MRKVAVKCAAAGIVVLSLVAVVVIYLFPGDGGVTESSGRDAPVSDEFHEFAEVVRIPNGGGHESLPDLGAMELSGNVAYVAYHADMTVRVTAVGLDDEGRWTRRVNSPSRVGMVSLVATPAALMVVVSYRQATGMSSSFYVVALDLSTGAVTKEIESRSTVQAVM